MVGEIGTVTRIAPQVSVEQVKHQAYAPKDIQKTDAAEKGIGTAFEEGDDSSYQMEDVVAVSEFGDTVQVSEEGKGHLVQEQNPDGSVKANVLRENELENFSIFPQAADEEEEEAEALSDAEASGAEDFEISSSTYKLYTDARLEQMYLKGEISRYDYETEVERREQEEQESEDRQESVTSTVKESDSHMQSVNRTEDAIEMALSDQASQATDPKMRLDIMQKLDQLVEMNQEQEKQEEQKQLQLQVG